MINRFCEIFIIAICIILFINIHTIVYADNQTSSNTSTNSDSWVSDAFEATKSFFSENVTDEMGIIEKPLGLISDGIKAITRIAFVLLAGMSTISLAIVGIRYMASISNPAEREKAIQSLHTTFKGMLYGFGAFFIWRIAMSIVYFILSSM